jgi:glycosyltransferase involved in cell wall biosynthesis
VATEQSTQIELSIVMPCLNEAATVAACVRSALGFLHNHQVTGEVIVADNGSSDGSAELAARAGARVIPAPQRGYGHALLAGIAAAQARFVIIGDADGSYDFAGLMPMLERLRAGADLVQGCRLAAGGGTIMPRAMPFLHRWLGNPLFTLMARAMFGANVHDVYCGLRGFRREWFDRLNLRCTGMEFAPEMVIKASLYQARIEEVPVTLHRDGRQGEGSHLRTFRDGWRTLRFLLLCSPRWLFLYPGLLLVLLGLAGYGVAMPGLSIRGITFDAHTLLFASLSILLGYQSILFSVFARTFAVSGGLLPPNEQLDRVLRQFTLERGLAVGGLALAAGLLLLLNSVAQWAATNFGRLDYSHSMRWVIPGVTLTALGFQTVLASFFVSILGLARR